MLHKTAWTALLLAIAIPLAALGVQWVLWPYIDPFVWFLFFPAVFFSARVGGLAGGMAGTVLAILLVWYFFVPVPLSWVVVNTNNYYSMAMFLFVGYLISDSQERLKLANLRVEEALEAANSAKAEITVLYRKTLELDELKTRFFTNMSHELRTPLTLILGPTEKCLADGGLAPQTRSMLEIILRNAGFLERRVGDLLDIAKLEAKRMDLDYAAVDLAHLVRAMASNFEASARERGIRFLVRTPERLPGQTDAEKVQRIVLNLVSNALKFTPAGGEVLVSLDASGDRAVLRVEDNGPGIPPEKREAVFERFRQLEDDPGRRHGGTGLGLAIVLEFAQLLGGNASVGESAAGGAQFTVDLPLAAPPGAPIRDHTGAPDAGLGQQFVDELGQERPRAADQAAACRHSAANLRGPQPGRAPGRGRPGE